MKLRDRVLEQIHHRETYPVPYTLGFKEDVGLRPDKHFGGDAWRERLVPYMAHCGAVAGNAGEKIDDTHYRDTSGTVWRTDLITPAVKDWVTDTTAANKQVYDIDTETNAARFRRAVYGESDS